MKQVPNYVDTRQLARCVYCAASAKNTLDHVPSKVLIDKPFPEGEGSSIYITDPDGNTVGRPSRDPAPLNEERPGQRAAGGGFGAGVPRHRGNRAAFPAGDRDRADPPGGGRRSWNERSLRRAVERAQNEFLKRYKSH